MGISPSQVEDCEIWEVAAMLGANAVDEDGVPHSQWADPEDFRAPG